MIETGRLQRIVTHGDFDGIVSAAVCSAALDLEFFLFTGPESVTRAELSIGPEDVVCDLPYPLECGMWFDHHPGNLEALRLRGIDPSAVPGRFEAKPSCARVVLEYFEDKGVPLQDHLAGAVGEADVIDSFDYRSIEEWRRETPGKLVDMSMKASFSSPREQGLYMRKIVDILRGAPLEAAVLDPEVSRRVAAYRAEEAKMIDFMAKSTSFLNEDRSRELVILDFTHHKRKPQVMRNLAYLIHPGALGAVMINPVFRGGTKTNGFAISLSLSMNMTGRDHGKDMGEIMRELNIGDGHAGAAAGRVFCDSKDEMLREKKKVLSRIWKIWESMPPG